MKSERIRLTPPSEQYLTAMYEAIHTSKDRLAVYLPWLTDDFSVQTLSDNLYQAKQNYADFDGEFWFNIIEQQSDRYLGAIGFMVRDKYVPYFEIGYWLSHDALGQGYATEAIGLIEQYAFFEKQAHRVEIKMAKSNRKSQAVAIRCGYQFEMCLANARQLPSGQIDDTMIYVKTV